MTDLNLDDFDCQHLRNLRVDKATGADLILHGIKAWVLEYGLRKQPSQQNHQMHIRHRLHTLSNFL